MDGETEEKEKVGGEKQRVSEQKVTLVWVSDCEHFVGSAMDWWPVQGPGAKKSKEGQNRGKF